MRLAKSEEQLFWSCQNADVMLRLIMQEVVIEIGSLGVKAFADFCDVANTKTTVDFMNGNGNQNERQTPRKALEANFVRARLGHTQEVARIICFLLSDSARYIVE